MAAILICGTAAVFTSCTKVDNPVDGETGASGIAMIVKNGQIDYWRQIEKAFRDICKEKDLEAYYYATSAENAYEEQLAAVEELRKLDNKKLKGIIFTPSYGQNGESAEAEVAALAQERGIPVIILDSPAKAAALASSPYFGTDNTAAGRAMAEKVMVDKVAVFAMTNSPGMERAEAFKALKPNAVIFGVADKCNDEVQAVLDEYDNFVFFNGNDLVDAIPMLKAAGKRVYTFDVYGEFLDELIAGSVCLQGIMAQNTFGMTRKAVEAALANAKQGEMVPTFYITEYNLDDDNVKPFLDFYGKQAPAVIDGLAEKILGKWISVEYSDEPPITNDKVILNFVSPTKCLVTMVLSENEELGGLAKDMELDVAINGDVVTLSGQETETISAIFEMQILSITDNDAWANVKTTINVNGELFHDEYTGHNVRITTDYSADIIGMWEGDYWNDDFTRCRFEYKDDGTYNFYYLDEASGEWKQSEDDFSYYSIQGGALYMYYKNTGLPAIPSCWDVTFPGNGVMKWKALRMREDGSTFYETMDLTKI